MWMCLLLFVSFFVIAAAVWWFVQQSSFVRSVFQGMMNMHQSIVSSYVDKHRERFGVAPVGLVKVWFYLRAWGWLGMALATLIKRNATSLLHDLRMKIEYPRLRETPEGFAIDYVFERNVYTILIQHNRFHHAVLVKAVATYNRYNPDDTMDTVDVTARIRALLGPGENWHHQPLTPQMLGYESLLLSRLDREEFEVVDGVYGSGERLPALRDVR